jgi:hypothetical protein
VNSSSRFIGEHRFTIKWWNVLLNVSAEAHNLLVAGPAWPRPNRRELKRNLAGIAAALAARPSPMRAAT